MLYDSHTTSKRENRAELVLPLYDGDLLEQGMFPEPGCLLQSPWGL